MDRRLRCLMNACRGRTVLRRRVKHTAMTSLYKRDTRWVLHCCNNQISIHVFIYSYIHVLVGTARLGGLDVSQVLLVQSISIYQQTFKLRRHLQSLNSILLRLFDRIMHPKVRAVDFEWHLCSDFRHVVAPYKLRFSSQGIK